MASGGARFSGKGFFLSLPGRPVSPAVQGKIDFKSAGIDSDQAYLDALPQAVGLVSGRAAQFLPLGIILEIVLPQRFHADHAFQRHSFQFDKQAEMRHPADDAVEVFPNPCLQQQAAETAGDFPLRVLCRAFAFIAAFGCGQQLVPGGNGSSRIKSECIFERAVRDQVGIAADGKIYRLEMDSRPIS